MLNRQEVYDELISGTKTSAISARTLRGSKALARLRLRERSHQANSNTDDSEDGHLDEDFTWERDGTTLSPDRFDEESPVQEIELKDVLSLDVIIKKLLSKIVKSTTRQRL